MDDDDERFFVVVFVVCATTQTTTTAESGGRRNVLRLFRFLPRRGERVRRARKTQRKRPVQAEEHMGRVGDARRGVRGVFRGEREERFPKIRGRQRRRGEENEERRQYERRREFERESRKQQL